MTSVREFGGEFALIDAISKVVGKTGDKSVLVDIGDDTAVIGLSKEYLMLWTVDMMVEGDHFRREWSTPRQVGVKAMESNVSDIAAMGGFPKYALVSISLPDDITVEWVKAMYSGMQSVAKKYGFSIIGGNTTHGGKIVVDTTIIGFVEKNRLCLRSMAKVGDLICVTGDLGKSRAGLELLLAGKKGHLKPHLEPKCRLPEAREISKHANAMIDVSDGLASEVSHICERSSAGAVILKHSIPLSGKTKASAKAVGKDPYEYALCGGEDYELVFTIPLVKLKKIRVKTAISVVGAIVQKKFGQKLVDGQKTTELTGGFDHFNKPTR